MEKKKKASATSYIGKICRIPQRISEKDLDEIREQVKHELYGTPIPEAKYLTVAEVGRYLNICRTTVWRYAKKGILKPRKIGSRVLFARADIDDYLNKEGGNDERH